MNDCIIRFKGKDGKVKFTQSRPVAELIDGILSRLDFDQLFTARELSDGRIELLPVGRFSLLLRDPEGEVLEEFPLSVTGEKNLPSIANPPAGEESEPIKEPEENEESKVDGEGSGGLERTGLEREAHEGVEPEIDLETPAERKDSPPPAPRRGRPRKEKGEAKRGDVKPAEEPKKRGRGRPRKSEGVKEEYTGFRLPPGTKIVNGGGSEVQAHVPMRRKALTEHHRPKPHRFPTRAWNGAE